MKTITITLTDTEAETLEHLTRDIDPSNSIKPTSVAHACLAEGLVRSAKRLNVSLPLDWLTTEALKRALAAIK